MIKIEHISVKDKYSISLCFNKDYSNEYIYFGTETDRRAFFSKGIYEKSENKKFKRNFGTFIEDGLRFAESDNLRAVRKCADGLADVLRQGRGLDQIEPYKAELFRIYNGSDNIVEQYVILKLWHEHTVKHNELNKILTSINPKNWSKFGESYAIYVDKMLLPFEKPFTSVDDVKELSGSIFTDIVEIEKAAAVCYTCEADILPLYMIYFTELSRRNKHILACEVCGRKFVASRKDTKVCGDGCKTVKQKGYNKAYKEKNKDNTWDKIYQQNRDGYDNFRAKLDRLEADENIKQKYEEKKSDFLDNGNILRKDLRKGKIEKRAIIEFVSDDRLKRLKLEEEILEELSSFT